MSYNGSGTFQINSTGQPVVTGTVISSSAFNALTADLATGLSTAITKDGQTTTTARIPFAQGINSSLATDTTNGSSGSIYTAGGIGIAKALYVGTTLNYGGVTLSAAVTGTGKMVLDTSPTLVTPALGTPSSGVVTNLTGTASININGTVGATTPSTGSFTSLAYSTTLTGGTGIVNLGSGQFYKDASGNVGVGTTSPAYKLEVRSTMAVLDGSANIGFWANGTSYTQIWQTLQSVNDFIIQTAASKYMSFGTNSTERMRLDTNGNLGIGTTSAQYKLVVAASGGNGFEFGPENTTSTNILQCYNRITSAYTNLAYNALSHQFSVSGSEAMRINSSGNVGIGTSSPASKLDISDASANSLRISGAGDHALGFTGYSGNSATQIFSIRNDGINNCYINTQNSVPLNFGVSTGSAFGSTTSNMSINSSGIVTMSAYGAGAATFSASGVISSVSDETWKIKDGAPIDPDSMLNKLEPGYWYYNDEKKDTFGTDRQLGFYAQNVNAAIGPEAAPTPEEGKPWGYYDRSVLAVTVMSLQKALATIESLTARIAALEAK